MSVKPRNECFTDIVLPRMWERPNKDAPLERCYRIPTNRASVLFFGAQKAAKLRLPRLWQSWLFDFQRLATEGFEKLNDGIDIRVTLIVLYASFGRIRSI